MGSRKSSRERKSSIISSELAFPQIEQRTTTPKRIGKTPA